MNVRRVVLLDDDEGFREALTTGLRDRGYFVIAPNLDAISPEELIEALGEDRSDVLMDVNLGRGISAFQYLTQTAQSGVDWGAHRIWLMSGRDTVETLSYRQEFPAVQEEWLGKPCDVDSVITLLEEGAAGGFELPIGLEALTVPLRVVDHEGRVVFCNDHWRTAANRPDPRLFLKEDGGFVTELRHFWGFLPDDIEGKSGIYRLRSFPLSSGEYLGQIAASLTSPDMEEGLDKQVELVFDAMAELGFHRGRLYRRIDVPGSSGLLQLTHARGGLQGGVELPVTHPLSGVLLHRFQAYEGKISSEQDPLHYLTRRFDADMDRENDLLDEGICYWNGIVLADHLTSWVEVPLFGRRGDSYVPTGLFVFDRLGEIRLNDGDARTVTDDEVQKVEPTIIHAIRSIDRALVRDQQREARERCERLSRLDSRLFCEVKQRALVETLLSEAVDISGADGGLLIVREPGASYLTVWATNGEYRICLLGGRFSLDAEHHPVVMCWKTGEVQYYPNYRDSPVHGKVLDEANIESLCPGVGNQGLRSWLESGIGSLVAMPIHAGDQVVGAVSLQHKDSYRFTVERVQYLEQLLQRMRWFLHAAAMADRQRMWEHALVHEMKSDTIPILHGVDALMELASAGGTQEQKKHILRVQRSALHLRDLSDSFLSVSGRKTDIDSAYFDAADKSIGGIFALYSETMAMRRVSVDMSPPGDALIWRHPMKVSKAVFERVARILFDNAQKYADPDSVIRISALLKHGYWSMDIVNEGQMTDEEDERKFEPYRKPEQPRRDGSHVSLAASRIWVDAFGGRLDLKNARLDGSKPCVVASVCWIALTGEGA